MAGGKEAWKICRAGLPASAWLSRSPFPRHADTALRGHGVPPVGIQRRGGGGVISVQ